MAMVSWDFYCKRRGYSLPSVILSFGLDDYEKLSTFCKTRGVITPPEEEFNMAKPQPKKPPVQQAVPEIVVPEKTPPKKKTTRRRTRKKQE